MLVNLYKKYIKYKFFNRMFLLYLSITVAAIIITSYLAAVNINMSTESREKEKNDQVSKTVSSYFEQKINSSKNLVQSVYVDSRLQDEILYIMENGYKKHLEYKYDKLLSSTDNKYNGFENYFKTWLQRDSDILGICLYSYKQDSAYIYSDSSSIIYPKDPLVTGKFEELMKNPFEIRVIPSHNPHYITLSDKHDRVFSVAYQVNEKFSSNALGIITIDYRIDGIEKAFLKFSDNYKGRIIMITHKGEVVFDSAGIYNEEQHPYMDELMASIKNGEENQKNIISTQVSDSSGILTSAVLPRNEIQRITSKAGNTIIIIAILCITATILLTSFVMNTFSRRINSVMEGIKSIRQGDLSRRISIENNEDEISEIASSFNSMCTDLNEYIQKVYVSEIKQKNAQLTALQAQINPHFLYNTLESIRMRAVIKGAKDVSDMIYLLSNLFRSSIKDKMIVSIDEEIKHSKMYIELFNIRFMNKIRVDFDIKGDVRSYAIIKHSIQPLIENYILHGLDMDREDNNLLIKAEKIDGDIFIYIMDNGTGISKEKLDSVKESLHNLSRSKSSSIGLSNVNERLKILFGSQYGVSIDSREDKGTSVTLRIPAMTIEELEENVQGSDSG